MKGISTYLVAIIEFYENGKQAKFNNPGKFYYLEKIL